MKWCFYPHANGKILMFSPYDFKIILMSYDIVVSKIDENRCKQTLASYLDFGRADSLSLQLYLTYHRLLHM